MRVWSLLSVDWVSTAGCVVNLACGHLNEENRIFHVTVLRAAQLYSQKKSTSAAALMADRKSSRERALGPITGRTGIQDKRPPAKSDSTHSAQRSSRCEDCNFPAVRRTIRRKLRLLPFQVLKVLTFPKTCPAAVYRNHSARWRRLSIKEN